MQSSRCYKLESLRYKITGFGVFEYLIHQGQQMKVYD